MMLPLSRVLVIARNTLLEAVRQKVLNVLLIFAIVLVGISVYGSGLSTPDVQTASTTLYAEQIKFVKDVGSGVIGIFGFFIALLSVAQLIPQELHNRTIYTILSKPVRRAEFLLGKFFGIVLLVALAVSLMTVAFAAALYIQEVKDLHLIDLTYGADAKDWHPNPTLRGEYEQDIQGIKNMVNDPRMVEAILLIFAKLIMVTGIGLLVSTFATSSIFTIITTFLIYLIGHMEGAARAVWLGHGAETNFWLATLVGIITTIIPDMNSFSIVDEIWAGNNVPWSHTLDLLGYSGVYVVVIVALSMVIFDFREI